MFIRRKKNASGSISVQIIDKSTGKFRILETIGFATNEKDIRELELRAYELMSSLMRQKQIDFTYDEDSIFVQQLQQGLKQFRVVGPDLVLGKLFEDIGFGKIEDSLFKELIITRLICPGSKLKTINYLKQYKGLTIDSDSVYRYMDKFYNNQKDAVLEIVLAHTKQILNQEISISFYDITTLYFEAEDEDDLRKKGFSKDGKAQNPQILLALLVSTDGYPLSYEIFKGDTFEGHTLIPVINEFKSKYGLKELIVVADAGLLSKENIETLIKLDYPFILGARLKNENSIIQQQIFAKKYIENTNITIQKTDNVRLIVHYSTKRAKKDEHTRQQGLQRLEKNVKTGKLTKEKINNRGYNKYLKIKNEIDVAIDYTAFNEDRKWNGLKGYITNSNLNTDDVMANYKHLWNIEKAFRVSKSDLKVRPIFHRLERRIRAHICLAFCSYKLYKEFERILKLKQIPYSVDQALELLKTIYEASIKLPVSKKQTQIILPLNKTQQILIDELKIDI